MQVLRKLQMLCSHREFANIENMAPQTSGLWGFLIYVLTHCLSNMYKVGSKRMIYYKV